MNATAQGLIAGAGALPEAPGFLDAARRAGREAFERSGLPTTREEDWRFTSLAPLAALAFGHAD
ncbi:MAG: Fe-S cluster assembly protein SufD, partial [Anaeromyxobacteraceae bacterium]